MFFPYEGLLAHGRVVRDRAALVEPHRVDTAAGERIDADYIVLATGSSYPFPAKTDLVDTHHAQEQVRETHLRLASADRVLLLGAGPVGIELAGEIRHAWPDKSIVLLDVPTRSWAVRTARTEDRSCANWSGPALRCSWAAHCDRHRPPSQAARNFTVTTEAGVELTADIWFRCYGVVPNSDYLGKALAPLAGPTGSSRSRRLCR